MTESRNKFDANNAYGSARNTFSVTPHDSTNFTINADALYVGGAGNITLINEQGNVQLFTAVPVGTILPVRCSRVNSTATTATAIVGLVCS